MDVREKLVELQGALGKSVVWGYDDVTDTDYINYEETSKNLIAHGVTVQECCHKAESVISKTGLMCTACHSDIDRDAVFCKYCGAKVMPQPPKGE